MLGSSSRGHTKILKRQKSPHGADPQECNSNFLHSVDIERAIDRTATTRVEELLQELPQEQRIMPAWNSGSYWNCNMLNFLFVGIDALEIVPFISFSVDLQLDGKSIKHVGWESGKQESRIQQKRGVKEKNST